MATRNSTRLTDKFIRSLKPPATGNKVHTDSEVPGFGVRITAKGTIAFVLDYQFEDRNRRGTLARRPEYNASAARNKAIDYRRQLGDGINPFEDNEVLTLKQLSKDYLDLHANVKKAATSAKKDEQILDNLILLELGEDTRIDKLGTKRIEELHVKLKDTPYQANRVLSLLGKMFSLAVKWKHLPENPCKGIDKYPENPRERYLNKAELKQLVEVLDAYPDRNIAKALVLMMLTGCRKTEALRARWEQFDLEEGVWTKPSHHTKQKRVHRVPLNPAAVALLAGIKQDGEWIFPGRVEGQPLADIKKAWEKIRKDANISDVRMHDLRHTYASLLASQNLSLPVIGALLGHTQAQTTKRYAHLLDEPLRDATNGVGKLIEGVRE